MDFDELMQELKDGTLIACETPEEREAFLRYMVDNGFELGACTESYLHGRRDFEYPNPGWNNGCKQIHCWTNTVIGKKKIPFSEIDHLVYGTRKVCDLPDLSGLFE